MKIKEGFKGIRKPDSSITGIFLAGMSFLFLSLFQDCAMMRGYMMKQVVGSFDGAVEVFMQEEDPELVKESLPVTLKAIEVMLQNNPESPGLLLSASTGFFVYAHFFLIQESEYEKGTNWEKGEELCERGRLLVRRARDYALKALEIRHPSFLKRLRSDPEELLREMKQDDIPYLYWLAVSWAELIGLEPENYELLIDLPLPGKIIERCLALDDGWNQGALHEFMVTYEAGRAGMGGSIEKAKMHYRKALQYNKGRSVSIYVTAAEVFSIPAQNKEEFRDLLQKVLDFDVERYPRNRLVNVLAQKRARWLLNQEEYLFYQ